MLHHPLDLRGVVGLEVLHYEIVGRASLGKRGQQIGTPLVGLVGVDSVDERDFIVENQIRII